MWETKQVHLLGVRGSGGPAGMGQVPLRDILRAIGAARLNMSLVKEMRVASGSPSLQSQSHRLQESTRNGCRHKAGASCLLGVVHPASGSAEEYKRDTGPYMPSAHVQISLSRMPANALAPQRSTREISAHRCTSRAHSRTIGVMAANGVTLTHTEKC